MVAFSTVGQRLFLVTLEAGILIKALDKDKAVFGHSDESFLRVSLGTVADREFETLATGDADICLCTGLDCRLAYGTGDAGVF